MYSKLCIKINEAEPKPPAFIRLSQSQQPVRNFSILVAEFWLIEIAGLADCKGPAHHTYAHAIPDLGIN